MIYNKFNKTRLATSLSLILGATALTAPVFAAEEAEEDVEVIEVKGIRGSLMRAMDVKRESTGVVDAISAEDMGKFPDTNLAESLQRITGVSIDRANGEGSKVSVRGFGPDFNLVTLNGRQMPVGTGSRSFDFGNLASEGVSGVEVYKTSNATISTGGIGATINLLTNRPLNSPGMKASFGLKAVVDNSAEDGGVTPELSGMYSDTFADDTFGVSISGSHQQRESGNKQAYVDQGWRTFDNKKQNDWGLPDADWGGMPINGSVNRPDIASDGVYSVPQTTVYKFEEQERTRTNGQLVLQYQPVENVTATLDYTYSKNEVDTASNEVSAWFAFAGDRRAVYDTSANGVSTAVISSEYYDPNAQEDLAIAAGKYGVINENNSIGFNVEWNLTDDFTVEFDVHDSSAESRPNSSRGSNNKFSTAIMYRDGQVADFSGDVPVLSVAINDADYIPSNIYATGSTFGSTVNKSDVDQFRVQGTYEFDDGSIDFGISNTEVSNRTQSTNVQRNDWSGVAATDANGIANGSEGFNGLLPKQGEYKADPGTNGFDDEWFTEASVINNFGGSKGSFAGVNDINAVIVADNVANGTDIAELSATALNKYYKFDFDKLATAAGSFAPIAPLTLVGDCGTQFCQSTDYSAQTDRFTVETSTAFFTQANFTGEVGDSTAHFSAGVRWETTNVRSDVKLVDYSNIGWVGDTEFVLELSPERRSESGTGSYDYILPNVNFDIEVVEDVVFRASWSKTLGRPGYNQIQGGTIYSQVANANNGSGERGNPGLLPLVSTNLDFSLEWYYDDSSYVSVGWYAKDTENFIAGLQQQETIDGLNHPVNGWWAEQARANGVTDNGAIRTWIFDNAATYALPEGADEAVYRGAVDTDKRVVYPVPGVDSTPVTFNVNVPTNEGSQKLKGMEFAAQHIFGESGFGLQANYTMVDDGAQYDNASLNDSQALIGLSDTYNIVAFYDNHGVQARIAYNWRDDFLNARSTGTGNNPVYTEAYGQFDANVSYTLPEMEELTVFVEALNLTDESTRTYGRSTLQTMNYTETGARFNIGARYTF